MSVLQVHNLGKSFREYRSEWHRFARWFGLPVKPHAENWVARHISFEIPPGEAVGIIGQNGAGKSTLLKMITGTMHPTEGNVHSNGRISAILELGMGFNPELSGRENVRHAAGLMGFNAEEILQALPDIEAFAEIDEYFDEPVRTYSSGMQMRIAFAVATAWRPPLLIVDEALSVGDGYFQHKCFNRIREFQQDGTSLLIVSHDSNAIQGLCSRVILLEQGCVIKDGKPEEVFDYYNAILAEKNNRAVKVRTLEDGKVQTSSGSGEAVVEQITLYDEKGELTEHFDVGKLIEIRIDVRVEGKMDCLILGYVIKDRLGQTIFGTNTWHTEQPVLEPSQGDLYHYKIKFPANLGMGSYSISTALHADENHLANNYEWRDLAQVFYIYNANQKTFVGSSWIPPEIEINLA